MNPESNPIWTWSKSLNTISETCKCGAKFEVVGKEIFCMHRYQEFLNAHKKCRERCEMNEKIPCDRT